MSHAIEEYAKCLGVKVGQPVISEHFYPVPSDNYITINTDNKKFTSKNYDHWVIVFELIRHKLKENNIDVIQVGGAEDLPLKCVDCSILGVSLKQMAYIVKNSKLHFGPDTFISHIASAFDINSIILYGNSYPECSAQVWNKESKSIKLTPDFSEIKPSFNPNETIKRINEIAPEDIAKSILSVLNIDFNLDSYETVNIGKYYNNKVTEVVPDFVPAADFKPETVINLRCDYELLPESLEHWMKYKVNLMIDDKLDPNVIYENRKNIAGMTIFMDKGTIKKDYLDFLTQIGLKYNLICKNKDLISDIRMEFFDLVVEEYSSPNKKDLDFVSELCDNTFYHSNKTLISNNKEYYSKAAWKSGIEKTEDHQKAIDSDEFWEEVEHLNIYNYAEDKKN